MATEMNVQTRTADSSIVFRQEDATFGKAEVIASLQAALGAGYVMGFTALVIAWIDNLSFWMPFGDVSGSLIPALASPGMAFYPITIIISMLIHFSISLALGVMFALLYTRVIRINPVTGLPVVVGFVFGTITWLLARFAVLPILGSDIYARPTFLIAHLAFGATIGLLYPLLAAHNRTHLSS